MPNLRHHMDQGLTFHRIDTGRTPSARHEAFMNCCYKSQAIKAAKDLGYGEEVIERIENAKCDAEITRIMKTERERRFE